MLAPTPSGWVCGYNVKTGGRRLTFVCDLYRLPTGEKVYQVRAASREEVSQRVSELMADRTLNPSEIYSEKKLPPKSVLTHTFTN